MLLSFLITMNENNLKNRNIKKVTKGETIGKHQKKKYRLVEFLVTNSTLSLIAFNSSLLLEELHVQCSLCPYITTHIKLKAARKFYSHHIDSKLALLASQTQHSESHNNSKIGSLSFINHTIEFGCSCALFLSNFLKLLKTSCMSSTQ